MGVNLEFITPNAVEMIGRFASICYDSNKSKESCIRRATSCKDKGHLATMRFAHAVFHVYGISRACSHQMVRSRHLDFLQRSQRYCNEEDRGFIMPPNLTSDQEELFASGLFEAKYIYEQLIDSGIRKEDARFILPEGAETELYVVGNLQAWKDFISLRATKHAQWEIRQVAIDINNLLSDHCPELFTRIYEDVPN